MNSIFTEVTERTRNLANFGVQLDSPVWFCYFARHDEEAITRKHQAGAINKSYATNTLKWGYYLKLFHKCVIPWRQFDTVYDFKAWLKKKCEKLQPGVYFLLGRSTESKPPKRIKTYIHPLSGRRVSSVRRVSGHFVAICKFTIKEGEGLFLIIRPKHRLWTLFSIPKDKR